MAIDGKARTAEEAGVELGHISGSTGSTATPWERPRIIDLLDVASSGLLSF
jgi:hypothetical protein